MQDIDALIAGREKANGDFIQRSTMAQGLKSLMRAAPGWEKLSHAQRDAVDMISSKLSRILVGDPNHPDHWEDIQGYARLVQATLEIKPKPVRPTIPVGGLPPTATLGDAMRKVDAEIG